MQRGATKISLARLAIAAAPTAETETAARTTRPRGSSSIFAHAGLVCRHRQRAGRAGQPEPANHAPTRSLAATLAEEEVGRRRVAAVCAEAGTRHTARDPAAAERIQISQHAL